MGYIEDSNFNGSQKYPLNYTRPLYYTHDPGLGKDQDGFHYIFDEGGLTCSEPAERTNEVCLVAPDEPNLIKSSSPSFIYLDCGAWLDNADGKGKRCRDFGLVCGPHVYLCEYQQGIENSLSKIAPVKRFFDEMEKNTNASINVLGHIDARSKIELSESTLQNTHLYLIIPDLHLPPISFFTPPFLDDAKVIPDDDPLPYNYYDHSEADIFGNAGKDLVEFVKGLSHVVPDVKNNLTVIQLGDMFELWLGFDYQYKGGQFNPEWKDGDHSRNLVISRAIEVMKQNKSVFDAFYDLEKNGPEVCYLWGNHDAYLKDLDITLGNKGRGIPGLGIASRWPSFSALNGDLFIEHGHRFDRSNWDGVFASSGPLGAQIAYEFPIFRGAEPWARSILGGGHPQEVDGYLLGASLCYLSQKYHKAQKPFSIYVMGHTHSRKLFTYKIQTREKYSGTVGSDRMSMYRK